MKNDPYHHSEQAALIRFKAVNFIEEQIRKGYPLASALREASLRPWPEETGRYYAPRTMEDWWYLYKKGGFGALGRKRRADEGTYKVIDQATGTWLIQQVCKYPNIPVKVLYEHWQQKGKELPPLRSVYRYLQRSGYDRKALRAGRLESGPTKAFESPHVNDLWMVDFSPGPKIRQSNELLNTQLCVIIDDCSRLLPFAAYYRRADTQALHQTLKEAVLRRGLPYKLYTDQGKPFVNQHTRIICANLGIRLLHAKPYHSWSKGKIERVIYTLQQGFESTLRIEGEGAESLEELNRKLSGWIQSIYHQRRHTSTGAPPETRYQEHLGRIRKLDVDPGDIEALFYTHIERTVRKDGTVRVDNTFYEVDLSLRALRVELRFDPFSLSRIEVWYQKRFMGLAQRVNLALNSQTGEDNAYEKRRV
jgi:transposase InsO family protein